MSEITTIQLPKTLRDRLREEKLADGETFAAVIERLLDHSEATAVEREADPETIAEEVTTALSQGDVPVVLAEGQLEKLRTVGE